MKNMLWNRVTLFLLFVILCTTLYAGKNKFRISENLCLYDGTHPLNCFVSEGADPVVGVALEMFASDFNQVTGGSLVRSSSSKASILVVQYDKSRELPIQLSQTMCDSLKKREAFYIYVNARQKLGQLVVVGSDARGTAYGILELSRMLGVSPWIWWGDSAPEKKSIWSVPKDYTTFQSPSVEYRGIFINDEDWSLQPWSYKNFESCSQKGRIGVKTYREVFKLLLRLRANMIWPAMHETSVPFYQVEGVKEAADSCGIVIGTSHCEPMMRNNTGEWDKKRLGEYNYRTNRECVLNYWAERVKDVGRYENFYTVGMRGIHDSGMEGYDGLQEKTEALQQVIRDQRHLLSQYVNADVTRIPQVFVPYKEVLQVLDNGLQIPDDVTLMWCDDNYGYMTRLSNEAQRQRKGGSGVYYHLSYWGRPHDYLWLGTTQPGLVYNEMKLAYAHQARKLWIANVHDIRSAAYDLELLLDMAWNIHSVDAASIYSHMERWLCREFGNAVGHRLLPVMQEFYRLCGIRKPEFMGWNQVELDKRIYSRGWSPVSDTEFSLTEFGDELDRYLEAYRAVRDSVLSLEKEILSRQKDAFFTFIHYPVCGASAMATKMLEAQRARSMAVQDSACHKSLHGKDIERACVKSMQAYATICRLTDYYNHQLAGGKWNGLMNAAPRDLYVFRKPSLPIAMENVDLSANETEGKVLSSPLTSEILDGCIVRNACSWDEASVGVIPVQALGHSMNAVSIPKGSTLSYEFSCDRSGAAIIRLGLVPTQPNDGNDLRFSIAIDGQQPIVVSLKESYRSEGWKRNVLRGQALKQVPCRLERGKHTLVIKALDDHLVLDQWMIDFKSERKFYVFPVAPVY